MALRRTRRANTGAGLARTSAAIRPYLPLAAPLRVCYLLRVGNLAVLISSHTEVGRAGEVGNHLACVRCSKRINENGIFSMAAIDASNGQSRSTCLQCVDRRRVHGAPPRPVISGGGVATHLSDSRVCRQGGRVLQQLAVREFEEREMEVDDSTELRSQSMTRPIARSAGIPPRGQGGVCLGCCG